MYNLSREFANPDEIRLTRLFLGIILDRIMTLLSSKRKLSASLTAYGGVLFAVVEKPTSRLLSDLL
jgi:hypothetical protein